MFSYMFAHEAHHRGQAIMLAHQLGYNLPDKAAYGIWRREWFWKQCGFKTRPGQGGWQVARTSTRKSQQTRAHLET
jgi:hypothetical protein